jgi:hypothetical protein
MKNPHQVQALATIAWVVFFGGWQAYNALSPNPNDAQWVADVQQHPFATMSGSVLPTIILAPLVYWLTGKIARRLSNDDPSE